MRILTKKCTQKSSLPPLKSSICDFNKVPPGADRPLIPVSYATASDWKEYE